MIAPKLNHCLSLYVQIGKPEDLGALATGHGTMIDITGGVFDGMIAGQAVKGEIMSGGADWQIKRPDGITELRAHYGIRMEDGTIIQVHNHMIIRPTKDPKDPYRQGSIRFEAPIGPFERLNQAVFVSTLNAPADPKAPVSIRVFELV